MIQVVKDHIQIDSALHASILRNEKYVYASILEDNSKLVITPLSNTWFHQLHNAQSILIKDKSVNQKSLNIRPLLIDHDLELTDGELKYEVIERTHLLKIEI